MMLKRSITLFIVFSILLTGGMLALVGCDADEAIPEEPVDEPENDVVEVEEKFDLIWAGTEPAGDFTSLAAEDYTAAIYDYTDGQVEFVFYEYGALGEIDDVAEAAVRGTVDGAHLDYGWTGVLVPELQVTALHYLFPRERVEEVVEWISQNGDFLDFLEEVMREQNLVPVGFTLMGWQYITSNSPIESISDMEGLNKRVMDAAILNDQWSRYGASPTATPFGEVYGGLQMGMLDAQTNPIHSIYSMAFYEVQDYIIQIWNEPFTQVPSINADTYDSLPEHVQEFMKEYYMNNSARYIKEYAFDIHEEQKAIMSEERPEITYIYIEDDEVLSEFKEAVRPSHEAFIEGRFGGERTREAYEVLTNDIERAKEALGIDEETINVLE